jgi:hypothetical protein
MVDSAQVQFVVVCPVGPASTPRIPPESRTSHRTVLGRGTRSPGQILSGKVLQRLSCSVRHFGIFLLHSFVLSDLKWPRQKRRVSWYSESFCYVSLSIFYTGAISYLLSFIPRKGRGEEGPRGLSKDSDGVIDQRRKRDSEDLPPAHSSLDSPIVFQAPDPV